MIQAHAKTPGKTRIAAIDQVQADRFVFITASVLSEDLEATLLALPNPVLRKPFGVQVLRDLVRVRIP